MVFKLSNELMVAAEGSGHVVRMEEVLKTAEADEGFRALSL